LGPAASVVVTQFNGAQESCRGGTARQLRTQLFVLLRRRRHAFWTYAPAALTPPAWRPLAYRRGDRLRRDHQPAPDGVWRALFTDVAAAGW
jgi:hypothetical protein